MSAQKNKRARPQLNLQPIKKWKEAAESNMISAQTLADQIKADEAPMIVDVRSIPERADGYIKGSLHVAYSDPEEECANEVVKQLEASEHTEVVCLCMYSKERGPRIAQKLRMLLEKGDKKVLVLTKGFQGFLNTCPDLVDGLNKERFEKSGSQGLVWKPDIEETFYPWADTPAT